MISIVSGSFIMKDSYSLSLIKYLILADVISSDAYKDSLTTVDFKIIIIDG